MSYHGRLDVTCLVQQSVSHLILTEQVSVAAMNRIDHRLGCCGLPLCARTNVSI